MKDGLLLVLRMYCGYDAKMIAEATGIALARYKRIEAGDEEPDDSDIEKIAAVFGVSAAYLKGEDNFSDGLMLRQNIEELVFASDEMREQAKLRVTELSDLEKKLILLVRSADNSEQALLDAINTVLGI